MKRLAGIDGTRLYKGLEPNWRAKVKNWPGWRLPPDYETILSQTNGIEVFFGYVRLFGISDGDAIESVSWNDVDVWKFAWDDRATPYWCFAETAWGDQYSFSLEHLEVHGLSEVFILDALTMKARPIFTSFTQFMEEELLRQALQPYDLMILAAHKKFGHLPNDTHINYQPSLLLNGIEDARNIIKQNARSAMICNGDLALQLDRAHDGQRIVAADSYEDEFARTRIRLILD